MAESFIHTLTTVTLSKTAYDYYAIFLTAEVKDYRALCEGLKSLISKYKVDLVLQGHDHTYARGYLKNEGKGLTMVKDAGIVYVVSVSGPKNVRIEKL